MIKNNARGLKRITSAFSFSVAGLRAAWIFEEAFRIEVLLFIVLLPVGIIVGETPLEKGVLIGCLFIVLITELLNTGIEAAIDRIGEEQHILSGRAKDLGSAAVFISLANLTIVWSLILVPKYI